MNCRVLNSSRKYLGNTREPFAVTLAGEKIYVLTSAKDVAEACRKTNTISHDGFVQYLMKSFGAPASVVDKMYQMFSIDGRIMYHPNPHQKSLAHLTVDFHRHQLLPGKEQEILSDSFFRYIDTSLRWENMDRAYLLKDQRPNHVTISLHSWCLEVLVKAATNAFFGDRLLQMDPMLPQSFNEFDKSSWMLLYQVPKAVSSRMTSPLAKNIESLTEYFRLPKVERPGASWFNQTLEAEQRQLGISEEDVAKLMMLIHWGYSFPFLTISPSSFTAASLDMDHTT